MVRAAHERFVERGFTGATMADIAEAANVAVQTLYFTFHTKAELLQACYELAVLGEDDPTPPLQQPWFQTMLRARSGRTALRAFAEGNSAIVQRVGTLDDIVRSALHEPDAVEVRVHSEQLRRDGYRTIVDHLHERYGLRPELSAVQATDLLLTFGSASPYRSLVIDYGWTIARYIDWLTDTLDHQLLAH